MLQLPVWLAAVVLVMALFSWAALGWFARVGNSPNDSSTWVGFWLLIGAGGFGFLAALSICTEVAFHFVDRVDRPDAMAFLGLIFVAVTAVAVGWWLQRAAEKK